MNRILEHALFGFQFLIKVGQWPHLGNFSNLCLSPLINISDVLLQYLFFNQSVKVERSNHLFSPFVLSCCSGHLFISHVPFNPFFPPEVLAEVSSFKLILKHFRATENLITVHGTKSTKSKTLSSLPSISQTRVHCSHRYSNHFKVLLKVFLESPFVSRSQSISKTSDFLSFSFNRARNICIVCTVTVTAQVSGVCMQGKDDY